MLSSGKFESIKNLGKLKDCIRTLYTSSYGHTYIEALNNLSNSFLMFLN